MKSREQYDEDKSKQLRELEQQHSAKMLEQHKRVQELQCTLNQRDRRIDEVEKSLTKVDSPPFVFLYLYLIWFTRRDWKYVSKITDRNLMSWIWIIGFSSVIEHVNSSSFIQTINRCRFVCADLRLSMNSVVNRIEFVGFLFYSFLVVFWLGYVEFVQLNCWTKLTLSSSFRGIFSCTFDWFKFIWFIESAN